MQAFAYFPALVYRDERADLAEQVAPFCAQAIELARQDGASITQSQLLMHDPNFRDVADYLLVSAVNILRDQGYAVDRYDFHLSALWAQEIKAGSGTNVHVHKNSQMCGWMFIDAPDGGAYPIYHDPRLNKRMVELDFEQPQDVINATSQIHFNNVQSGTVLFGNSWLDHQLSGTASTSPTRCLHFIISHKDRPCSTC